MSSALLSPFVKDQNPKIIELTVLIAYIEGT